MSGRVAGLTVVLVARVCPVYLMNVERHQMVANPQTKPAYVSLLLFTSTIIIYCLFLCRKPDTCITIP